MDPENVNVIVQVPEDTNTPPVNEAVETIAQVAQAAQALQQATKDPEMGARIGALENMVREQGDTLRGIFDRLDAIAQNTAALLVAEVVEQVQAEESNGALAEEITDAVEVSAESAAEETVELVTEQITEVQPEAANFEKVRKSRRWI
jgi:hypothetical protein